jgi:hypothetical protein
MRWRRIESDNGARSQPVPAALTGAIETGLT